MEGLPAAKLLGNRLWRLENLYWIKDADANACLFKFRPVQQQFLQQMHYLNCLLKARQQGFTTLIMLLMLDLCLFNSDIDAGVIADTQTNAEDLFDNKVKFAWERLPTELRNRLTAPTDNRRQIKFKNGSKITIGTSHRGGTLQFLHVSELGKIATKNPLKSREIKSGAFNTVKAGNIIVVESTAEGRGDDFHDLCQESRKLADEGKKLTPLDFKFHFFPWWKNPDYRLPVDGVVIYPELQAYFAEKELKDKIFLDPEQKAWYAKKRAMLGEELMFQQYPSTPDEPFLKSIRGAYFKHEMQQARREGRICSVPHEPAISVNTAWDLGMNDHNSIWFWQIVGREIHLIDYYENSGEGLAHYWEVLQARAKEHNYHYGVHLGPHDLAVRELGSGTSRLQTAAQLGLRFDVVPRVDKKIDSIQAARNLLPLCWIDKERCARGIDCLDNYRKKWSDVLGDYMDQPLHDEYSNGADAYQCLAMGYRLNQSRSAARPVQPRSAAGWT